MLAPPSSAFCKNTNGFTFTDFYQIMCILISTTCHRVPFKCFTLGLQHSGPHLLFSEDYYVKNDVKSTQLKRDSFSCKAGGRSRGGPGRKRKTKLLPYRVRPLTSCNLADLITLNNVNRSLSATSLNTLIPGWTGKLQTPWGVRCERAGATMGAP